MKTITVMLKGGLGNQLYQYFTAKNLAVVHNRELVIDAQSGFERDFMYERTYALGHFNIPEKKIYFSRRTLYLRLLARKLHKKFMVNRPLRKRSYILQSDAIGPGELTTTQFEAHDIILDGYWQSRTFFEDNLEVIKSELLQGTVLNNENQKKLKSFPSRPLVMVHFRVFSEYDTQRNVPIEYYQYAIDQMKQKLKNPYFLVFSEQCEEFANRIDLSNCDFKSVNWNMGRGNEIYDLLLMARCNHFILANSTFGLWGCELGHDKSSLVYYPRDEYNTFSWQWGNQGQFNSNWIPVSCFHEI